MYRDIDSRTVFQTKRAYICLKCGVVVWLPPSKKNKKRICQLCNHQLVPFNPKYMRCPYCGSSAHYQATREMEGFQTMDISDRINLPEYAYVCDNYPECDSYVSVHKATKIAMGTLANKELRQKRIYAHTLVNRIMDIKKDTYTLPKQMYLSSLYQDIATKLNVDTTYLHFGSMNEELINKTISILESLLAKENKKNKYVQTHIIKEASKKGE